MIIGCPLCVVPRQQLLKRTSLDFLPNLAGIILIWPSLISVQMVMVHCIFRSHRLKIDEKFKTILV